MTMRKGFKPGGKPTATAGRGGRPRGRYVPRRKICSFCVDKGAAIDYKETGVLRRYISDRYKMEPKRKTGVCAGHQRELSLAIKRARHLALLPITPAHSSAI